ncbi:Aldose 1-epimerase [Galdieria sulphuraria]|nr:Aldose 1-epimerase [Galdieria sulphuraria]
MSKISKALEKKSDYLQYGTWLPLKGMRNPKEFLRQLVCPVDRRLKAHSSALRHKMTSLSTALPSNQQKNTTFAKKVTVDKTKEGQSVDLVELSLDCGSKAAFLTYGARIVSLCGADGHNVTLSLDTLAAYESDKSYQGASIGRVCNRIKDGQLTIGKKTYQLSQNEGTTCTHGGLNGFDKHVWKIESLGEETHKAYVLMSTFSPNGDQGFPGDVKATVKYELEWVADIACTVLNITYGVESQADFPTVVNLTNHVYWNLSGKQNQGENIWSHTLRLGTKEYLETDAKLLPTGRILQAEPQSYLDFTEERLLKGPPKEETGIRNGYDHFFVFDKTGTKTIMNWMSTVYNFTPVPSFKLQQCFRFINIKVSV